MCVEITEGVSPEIPLECALKAQKLWVGAERTVGALAGQMPAEFLVEPSASSVPREDPQPRPAERRDSAFDRAPRRGRSARCRCPHRSTAIPKCKHSSPRSAAANPRLRRRARPRSSRCQAPRSPAATAVRRHREERGRHPAGTPPRAQNRARHVVTVRSDDRPPDPDPRPDTGRRLVRPRVARRLGSPADSFVPPACPFEGHGTANRG